MDPKFNSIIAKQSIGLEDQAANTDIADEARFVSLRTIRPRHYAFALFVLLSVLAFWPTLKELLNAALHYDFCSQILVTPFVAIALMFWRRREIFRELKSGHLLLGGMSFLVGLLVYWLGWREVLSLSSYDSLSVAALGMTLVWVVGFYFAYGPTALWRAAFPMGFLIFIIPIPSAMLDRAVFSLQWGSTAIAHHLFRVLGVPVLRQGFVLALPGLTIEVAKECSSIRSSLALVITCLLAGYLFLRSRSKRTALVLLALPLSVFKNGVRIVTLSLLSIYVNPAFMRSDLHRDGGILFYLLALAILYPIFRWLEKLDHRGEIEHQTARRTRE